MRGLRVHLQGKVKRQLYRRRKLEEGKRKNQVDIFAKYRERGKETTKVVGFSEKREVMSFVNLKTDSIQRHTRTYKVLKLLIII